MSLLNRFRIGPKILGIVLVLLLLTAVVGGSGLFYLNQMNNRFNDVVDRSATKVRDATLLSRNLVEVVRAEKNTILAQDSAERERYIAATTDLVGTIADQRTELGALADAVGRSLLTRFDDHWQAYLTYRSDCARRRQIAL
jgi:methyl-accepting chemotaxis protein